MTPYSFGTDSSSFVAVRLILNEPTDIVLILKVFEASRHLQTAIFNLANHKNTQITKSITSKLDSKMTLAEYRRTILRLNHKLDERSKQCRSVPRRSIHAVQIFTLD